MLCDLRLDLFNHQPGSLQPAWYLLVAESGAMVCQTPDLFSVWQKTLNRSRVNTSRSWQKPRFHVFLLIGEAWHWHPLINVTTVAQFAQCSQQPLDLVWSQAEFLQQKDNNACPKAQVAFSAILASFVATALTSDLPGTGSQSAP